MRVLLDSHALLWWPYARPQLSGLAREAIGSAEEAWVSAVSVYELMLKHRRGQLPEAERLAANFESAIGEFGFRTLTLTARHAQVAAELDIRHRDPFDRMLIAQALVEDLVLVSNETVFDGLGLPLKRLW